MSEERPGWLRSSHTEPAAVAEIYDQWASSYDADLATWRYQAPTLTVAALAASQPTAAPVLDVGCGTGLAGRQLAAAGFDDVVGIDLSARSLERAAETGVYREVRQADVQSSPIPYDDDTFDTLVCVGVMTYLPDTAAVGAEFCRVVRPGGAILFTQRQDLWEERDCERELEAMAGDGWCRIESISEPLPYLPDSEELGDIPIRLVSLQSER